MTSGCEWVNDPLYIPFHSISEFYLPKAFRSTPTIVLETLFSLPPMDIYLQAEARITAYRLMHTGIWRNSLTNWAYIHPEINGHFRIEHEIRSHILWALNNCFIFPFKVTLGYRDDWIEWNTPDRIHDQHVSFTDGSRIGNQSGASIYGLAPRTFSSIYWEILHSISGRSIRYPELCSKRIGERLKW